MAKFFDKNEILQKAIKIWNSGKFLSSVVCEDDIFPIIINLKKIKELDIKNNFSQILKELKELEKTNLPIVYKEFNFKSIGLQKLPEFVRFEDIDLFLKVVDKQKEFNLFVKLNKKIITKFPDLKELIIKTPHLVLQNSQIWDELLEICDFFKQNPKPNIYIRELNIKGVDTKFIEKHKKILDLLFFYVKILFNEEIKTLSNYGFEKKYFLKYPLPIVRFRILDDGLKILNLSDISVTIDEFINLKIECEKVFIVENKITMLSFPKVKNAIVIFGGGFGVQSLKDAQWLKEKNIFYWGDIDTHGFAILSQARGYFKNIKSILMDEDVIKLFSNLAVKENESKRFLSELKYLTKEEQDVFVKLKNGEFGENFRLEQERVPFKYLQQKLSI